MQLAGIDPEKCKQRNRLAALRYQVEAAPIELAQQVGAKPEFSRGKLSQSSEEALAIIRSLQPSTATPLNLEDIYILPPLQAANNNFVGDRHLFLGSSTLRNIQREAGEGFAFMNSHRTGSVSTPSELPLGRTFEGRYERYPATDKRVVPFERTILGVYMLRGVYPNGPGGPSTDELYRQVTGGVLDDASMGINGGDTVCDICAFNVRSDECKHAPGTSRNIDRTQAQTQRLRGVPRGTATYTLEDGHSNEISGVYNGAIPGAGFSKAYAFAQGGDFSPQELRQFVEAYAMLLSKGDISMYEKLEENEQDSLVKKIVDGIGGMFRSNQPQFAGATFNQDEQESVLAAVQPAATTPLAPLAPLVQIQPAQIDAEKEELRRRLTELENTKLMSEAADVALSFVKDTVLLPAGQPEAQALAFVLSRPGEPLPEVIEYQTALGQTKRVAPIDLLKGMMENAVQHDLLVDHSTADAAPGTVLIKATDDTENVALSEAREDAQRLIDQGAAMAPRKNGASNNGKHA